MLIRKPTQASLAECCSKLGPAIDASLREAHGQPVAYVLIAFAFGPLTELAFTSNAQREGMIKTLREWLDKAEAGKIAPSLIVPPR